jgi:hypothetical protein
LAETSRHFKSLNAFKTPNLGVKTVVVVPKDSVKASKKDKIKVTKDTSTNSNEYAFAEFLKDSAFTTAFAKGQAAYKAREKRANYYESRAGKREYAKYLAETKKHGLKLGIHKVVIVNPFYLKLDARKETAVQYIATEAGQAHQRALIEKTAKAANLQTVILDVTHLKESQIDVFNDIRFLNEYFTEQNKLSGLSLTPGAQQNRIDSIAQKYGTDYFLWIGTVSLRDNPATIFAARHDMMHYAVLYDVRTGRNQTIKSEFFDDRDSDSLMKSQLYDTFLQIRVAEK